MFKRLFCWAYFQGSLFSEGLIFGRNFAFQSGLGLTIKTASTNSPSAYIREGLLSEGFVRLRFGGLIFGRAYLFIYFFFGGGGLIIGILRYIVITDVTAAEEPMRTYKGSRRTRKDGRKLCKKHYTYKD